LLGTGLALGVAVLLIWGGFALVAAVGRFGEPERVRSLFTQAAGKRRATKGVLVVFATALAFFAMAQPQYGRGTRLIPATNLDVVIVLDYSKSMYAQDIAPSRTARAKAEVARLIQSLPGARFAAVAFAGEPIGFPLTSDGAAISQFFRQLHPNDMPIGGTAIGRALSRANELLSRDPNATEHRRVIVLITDGEDLEGNPVSVAKSIGESGTTIHVVQIGGRTPEPIPDVNALGAVVGFRQNEDGKPLMTSLTAEGEEQLVRIAEAAGGFVVRSERGSTGIDVLSQRLEQMMEAELAEKVEVLYADVYFYPLGLALLLLLVDTFVGQAKRRRFALSEPEALSTKRGKGDSAHA
jgi:Ca-activated chloride channel family protein